MEDNYRNRELHDSIDKRKRIESFDKEKDKSNVEKDFS
jgi:hypothetical protein